MKKRGKIIVSVLLSLALLAAAACARESGTGGGFKQPPPKDGRTVLRWLVWDMEYTPYCEKIASAFEQAYPQFSIEIVNLGSTDYQNLMLNKLNEEGKYIDVVSIKDVPGFVTLVNKGMLLPLDSWMERDSISPDAYGGVLEQLRTGGHLYELPFRRDFWVLFYNKELFDRAGLNYPSNDMTLEEYDRLGRKLVELSKYDKIFGTHYHTWRSTVQLFGILDGEHRLLEGPYDYLIPYYEMALRQQGDHICQDYTTLRIQNIGYQGAFEEGKVGMMNMGTWYIMTLMNNIASGQSKGLSQWGIAKYPHPDGVPAGTTACTVASLGIPARSQHPEEAWEFVKFACGSEGTRILAGEGSLPALMDEQAIDAIVSLEGFPEDEASREALFTGETFLELPVDAQSPRIDKILNTVHDKIMMEKCTIEEGIEELERLVKEVE